MSQSWSASGRFGLVMAPGGAALVQDFLNTDAIGDCEDLLSDPVSAGRWADDAVQAWSASRGEELQPPALSTADLSELRALRSQIAGLLSGDVQGNAAVGGVSASFGLSETGQVRWNPRATVGSGWRPPCGARRCCASPLTRGGDSSVAATRTASPPSTTAPRTTAACGTT